MQNWLPSIQSNTSLFMLKHRHSMIQSLQRKPNGTLLSHLSIQSCGFSCSGLWQTLGRSSYFHSTMAFFTDLWRAEVIMFSKQNGNRQFWILFRCTRVLNANVTLSEFLFIKCKLLSVIGSTELEMLSGFRYNREINKDYNHEPHGWMVSRLQYRTVG